MTSLGLPTRGCWILFSHVYEIEFSHMGICTPGQGLHCFTHMRKLNLTYPVPTRGKDKNRIAARWNTSDVIDMSRLSIFRNF